jgi:Rps23 Pro-64 3,4-dihydroxylase Tpa1-like proline 4-hydroxylase
MIKVYDDLVAPSYRETIYGYIQNSLFRIGWQDGSSIETSNHRYIHSAYTKEDLVNSKFLEAVEGTEVGELFNTYEYDKTVVNLSVPSDSNFLHAHHDCIVVLYYANVNWHADWAGETIFYNDSKTEVTKAVNVKPGRVVVFDGSLHHSVRPQASIAPHYRFTLATTLRKNK